jgi:hypothetical protein
MMTQSTIAALRKQFAGEIILPQDITYESIKDVYSGHGSPAVIVRPQSTNDVAVAVNYARDNSLVVSVRSGGHSGAAFGTNDGGIVIDLSLINSTEVIDESSGIVHVGGGAKWGDIATILHQHALALSSGDTVSVGVGGLTLSGGIGWMVRKWGLTLDSLVGAEVVTANGKIVHVNESENADLFWAIRGGGGNFGVVTRFEFAAHKLGDVYFGRIKYDTKNIPDLIKKWRDYMRTASDELSTSITLLPSFAPGMSPSVMVLACFADEDEASALKAIEPLKHLGNMVSEDIQKKAYVDILEEAHPPKGMAVVIKNILTPDFSNELIKTTVDVYHMGNWIMQIRSLGGAMNRVPAGATAFAHRDSEVMMFAGAFVPDTSPVSALIDAAKPWDNIARFGTSAYANFISTRTDTDVAAATIY